MELVGFWAGAVERHGKVDVRVLAERAGRSLDGLVGGGAAALRQAGLAQGEVERWLATRLETREAPLTLLDEGYPEALASLADAPPVLFTEGDRSCLAQPAVSVVGTRRCTSYGRAVARHLGAALAAAGVTVVSGLARGIDAEAHRGALANGRTVAVLAHGLAHTAPSSHRQLRERLLESGGLLVSHWPDDVAPRPWQFLARNRWVAALAEAVVVVEAPSRSGALATARQALELGRDVYAVPHALGQESGEGCLQLLAEGAGVLTSVEAFVASRSSVPVQADPWAAALRDGPDAATLAARLGCSVVEVLTELSRRELSGSVVRLPGQRYALA